MENNFKNFIKNELDKSMSLFKEINKITYITQLRHTNIGDHIIYLGEKSFFKKENITIEKEINISNYGYIYNSIKSNDTTIVIRGGGYLGDIWYDSYKIIEKLVRDFRDNRIVIMPQSVYFRDLEKLKMARDIFSKHKNLTIFTRDSESYNFSKSHFKDNENHLCPDSAFFLLDELKNIKPEKKTDKILLLYRRDKEKSFDIHVSIDNLIKKDWKDLDFLSKVQPDSLRLFNKAIKLFCNKKCIITERLHGHILSSMMGITNIIILGNYHKIQSFYDTWTRYDSVSYLAKNAYDLNHIINHIIKNN